MDTAVIVNSLRSSGGNLSVAASTLKTSRQHIYDRIKADPVLQQELVAARESNRREKAQRETNENRVVEAVRSFTPNETAVRRICKVHGVSREVGLGMALVTGVSRTTGISKKVVEQVIAESDRAKRAFSARVTAETSPARTTVNTSLTDVQLRWIRRQPDGTMARLLSEVVALGEWPEVSDSADRKTQTTFSVIKADADALFKAAMDRGETSQTLLRQVLEVARRAGGRAR